MKEDLAPLTHLATGVLDGIARALRSGALHLPCTAAGLQHLVPHGEAWAVAAALNALVADDPATTAAGVVEVVAADRTRAANREARVGLVWSGPETSSSLNRDTTAVVRELLQRARRRVLISTYAIDDGAKARAIFGPLAERIDRGDPLDVRLFIHIHPSSDPRRAAAEVLAEFATRFRTEVWPGTRLPRLYYDPRTLDGGGLTRVSLHAKCIVIDETTSFVTSANFTEAAQWRNVEVGVIVEDQDLARSLQRQFLELVDTGVLRELGAGLAGGGVAGCAERPSCPST